MTITKEHILETWSIDGSTLASSGYQYEEVGYYLYAQKDKWIFPFKRTKVELNIKSATFPDDTIGLISGVENSHFDIMTKRVIHDNDFRNITVISNKLLPFKIKRGSKIALLSVVPSIECYTIGNATIYR